MLQRPELLEIHSAGIDWALYILGSAANNEAWHDFSEYRSIDKMTLKWCIRVAGDTDMKSRRTNDDVRKV